MQTDIIVLRPATADDIAFVDGLLFTTMHEYVAATWPDDQMAQKHYYKINACDPLHTRIIQIGGKNVGRLSITTRPDCVFVDEIHILPEYQGRGIGARLMRDVLQEAQARKLPVKLTVLASNDRARKLYRRLGFRESGEEDHRIHMEYRG